MDNFKDILIFGEKIRAFSNGNIYIDSEEMLNILMATINIVKGIFQSNQRLLMDINR